VERYRSEAFDYRSKYESLQDEYSGFVDSQAKEAEANQTLLKATRDALQRQIAELHKQLDLHAVDDTPRQLERLKTHLEVSEKQWSDDNTRVRAVLEAFSPFAHSFVAFYAYSAAF
jgi:chromosome segregation ATPase